MTSSSNSVKIANIPDLSFIGDVLHNYFAKDYSSLLFGKNDYVSVDVKTAITKTYSKLGINITLDAMPMWISSDPRPGDILITNLSEEPKFYSVLHHSRDGLITFPELPNSNYYELGKGLTANFKVIRPDFSSINKTELEDFINTKLPQTIRKVLLENSETFYVGPKKLPDGALQIGDIVFLIDPQQLVFTTQNDYQIYPTLRTHGNPKIPTLSQIKNISITMIFANESAINNQLLNLFAMFRRTPFVNMRNNDITEFFPELGSPDGGFISVALETISIQSIDGFPNSLQAQITFLPFDSRPVSGGFRALRSIADVKKQQISVSSNVDQDQIEKSNEILGSSDISFSRLLKQLDPQISTTYNFKESLPFRAFYQALIKERKFVCNEHGQPEKVTNLTGEAIKTPFSLDLFRPTKDENYLHEYKAQDNNAEIHFNYKYITGNFRQNLRSLSKERINKQSRLLESINTIVQSTETAESLADALFTTLHTKQRELNRISIEWKMYDQSISEILARNNIEVEDTVTYKLTDIWSYFRAQAGRSVSNTFLGTSNVTTSIKEISGILFSEKKVLSDDYVGLFNGLAVFENESIQTVRQYFVNWQNYINAGVDENTKKKRRDDFSNILGSVAEMLDGTLSGSYLAITNSVDGSTIELKDSGLEPTVVAIDNKNDIVVGWSLTFANKFIPLQLQAFKYPFYQHIGSEDVGLTLRIHSTNNQFKNKLHAMSEHIYDAVKIITLNSPDLLTYLDPRITVDSSLGNIFKVFGLHKVVYNGSNTTSIEGSPGSWMTVVNLTEANFNLNEYHQVHMVKDNKDLESLLMQFLLRLSFDDDKNLVIMKATKNGGESVTDLKELLTLSFINSSYGQEFTKYIDSIIAKDSSAFSDSSKSKVIGKKLGEKYTADIKKFKPVFEWVKDDTATSALQTLLKDPALGNMEKVLRTIVFNWNITLEKEMQALINLIKVKPGFMEAVANNLARMSGSEWVALGIGTGLVISVALLGGALFSTAAAGAIVASAGGAGMNAAIIGVLTNVGSMIIGDSAINGIKDTIGSSFTTLMENYKASTLVEVAEQILNDPVIATKILSKEFFGAANFNFLDSKQQEIATQIGLVDILRDRNGREAINCYPDFDIRPIFNAESFAGAANINSTMRIGPDFYIRNEALTGQILAGYLSETSNRILDTNKMCRMLALRETSEILTQYEAIKSSLDIANLAAIEKDGLKYNTDLATSLKNIEDAYISVSVASTTPGQDFGDEITADDRKKIVKDINDNYGKDESDKYFNKDAYIASVEDNLNARSVKIENKDSHILGLIEAARKKTLLELMILYTGVNNYMAQQIEQNPSMAQSFGVATTEVGGMLDKLSLESCDINAIKNIKNTIEGILTNFNSSEQMNIVLKKSTTLKKGTANSSEGQGKSNKEYLGLPALQRLENMLANKVADFIRLTTFLENAETTGVLNNADLEVLGEYGMIGYWNWQQYESSFKMFDMMQGLAATSKNGSTSTLKMFPTFKFFFVEDDSGVVRRYDELFTYDAIQSIEIINSKSAPGKTAVVRLSNLTGSLTDQLSLHREKVDLLLENATNAQDNAFNDNGKLNIKPGCGIIIKMGYAAHTSNLTTVFAGRITELSVGNNVEIIAQSYSTQLNHKVVQHKFCLGSDEKGHGDIATATLDMIPGLERLGKKIGLKDVTGIRTFNSTNISNYRGSMTDRLLMGNLFGKNLASVFGASNPRDENIFLPFDPLGEVNFIYKPTFDWVIYDQTVWSVMQELSLYYQNTIPIIKLFNNEGLSSIRDIRESLVIGNKSGYYKSTDAYSLSSLNVKTVEATIDNFSTNIKSFISNIPNTNPFNKIKEDNKNIAARVGAVALGALGPLQGVAAAASTVLRSTVASTKVVTAYTLNSDYKTLFIFLQDKLSADILIKYILARVVIEPINGILSVVTDAANDFFKNSKKPDEKIIFNLYQFSRLDPIPVDQDPEYNFLSSETGNIKMKLFTEIIGQFRAMQKMTSDKTRSYDYNLTKEEFYTISDIYKNTDERLAKDPRYSKIQQHHLITDDNDIIANNITLNDTFKNAVNLYYMEEPKLVSENNISSDMWNKINVFPIKSFGDLKDEYTRPLDTFQKNIDTNFWDCTKALNARFEKYSKIYNKDGAVQLVLNKLGLNIDEPKWDALPAFVTVGINLLKNETSKMYQGTIELVGNPYLEPYDVLHIQDYTNDMHGCVEIEEVIHSFTPDRGFRTVVTPNLITYDRDPIQNQDLQIISEVFRIAHDSKRIAANVGYSFLPVAGDIAIAGAIGGAYGLAKGGGAPGFIKGASKFALGSVGYIGKAGFWGKALAGALATALVAPAAWNASVGTYNKYSAFVYDSFCKIWGRDCINFTTLIYQGSPFISGFGGVDYANMKTIVNHAADGKEGVLSRLTTFNDPFMSYFDKNYNLINLLLGRGPLPGIPGTTNNAPQFFKKGNE
jgi:hypothetical protein